MSRSGIFEDVDKDIEKLKEKISILEEKIRGFDVNKKMIKAEAFLSDNMNHLSQTLDLKPYCFIYAELCVSIPDMAVELLS